MVTPKDIWRRGKDERTLKTADQYRQLWSAGDDMIVLQRGVENYPVGVVEATWVAMSDEEIATFIGRTFSSVVQRRSVLRKLMANGLTLTEIHDQERYMRKRDATRIYRNTMHELKATCPECFCNPHIQGCSNEGEDNGS